MFQGEWLRVCQVCIANLIDTLMTVDYNGYGDCPWLGGIWKLSWLAIRVNIYWLLRTGSRVTGKEAISMRSPQSQAHDFLWRRALSVANLRGWGWYVLHPIISFSTTCLSPQFLHVSASRCLIKQLCNLPWNQKLAPVGVRSLWVEVCKNWALPVPVKSCVGRCREEATHEWM